MSQATEVVHHITKTHFTTRQDVDYQELSKNMAKKFLFFYIAHELMFRSMTMTGKMGTQLMKSEDYTPIEGQIRSDQNNVAVPIDKFAYVKAIGDHIEIWCAHLCLELGESDYYRLNKIMQLINMWEQNGMFSKSFIDLMRRYILPQYELSKDKYENNQPTSILAIHSEASTQ